MKQYLDLLSDIVNQGVEKKSGRENMPPTIGISKGNISMDMSKGFPLLTTKEMFWKGIIHELLWFLRGETNIKYLVDNNVNVWNKDAYKWYLKYVNSCEEPPFSIIMADRMEEPDLIGRHLSIMSLSEFKDSIKYCSTGLGLPEHGSYVLGDLGKVYGYQWRNQNGVDQVADVFDGLKNNPYSRYHIIDGWNKADFNDMALPPCHLLYQFIVRPLTFWERVGLVFNEGAISTGGDLELVERELDDLNTPKFYLDLNMYQRSCDTFLGVPFNIASMSAMLMIFAKACNMIPGVANWIGGDTHLYAPHLPMAMEQLSREPFELPTLVIKKELSTLEDIMNLTIDDFELKNYKHHDKISAELFTGLKEDWGE